MTWWTFDATSGVLEFDGPALELQWRRIGVRSLAWWCDDQGRWLGAVFVGEC
jgi:hypothetical protein